MPKPLVIVSCGAGLVLAGAVWWLTSPPTSELDRQAELCHQLIRQCSDERDANCKTKLRRACVSSDLLPISRVGD
jgi:hypothetical protein